MDTAEDGESKSQTESYLEVEERQATQDDEEDADSGVEEDVFSHYTWSINADATEQDLEGRLQDRVQLKDSIRQSLLFKAFEAIDMAL